MYDKMFLNKPVVLLLNKMDTEGASDKYCEIKDKIKNLSGEYHKSIALAAVYVVKLMLII